MFWGGFRCGVWVSGVGAVVGVWVPMAFARASLGIPFPSCAVAVFDMFLYFYLRVVVGAWDSEAPAKPSHGSPFPSCAAAVFVGFIKF